MISPAQVTPQRICILNQFYPPSLAPTAHLSASLAEHLASQGHKVTVLTSGEGYVSADTSRPVEQSSVEVIQLWTPRQGKSSVLKRLGDYFSFLGGAMWHLLSCAVKDEIISLTTPPFVVVAAAFHRLIHRRSKLILWSMDCYPDVIERLGSRTGSPSANGPSGSKSKARPNLVRRALAPALSLRRGGPISIVLRSVNRWVFRRLDHVVTLDGAMSELLSEGYAGPAGPPMTVIPNWEMAKDFPPYDGAKWAGYSDEALAGRFVVLYLGNLGFGHEIHTVADAAALSSEAEIAWLFIGGGARWSQMRKSAKRSKAPILQRDYVPKSLTPAVMAGAGCALILLSEEALGVMSPSKLHANLAAGLPILYVGPEGSNVDEAITKFDCGIGVRNGDSAGVLAAVEKLRTDPALRSRLSLNARRAFEEAYSDTVALQLWDEVLKSSI